VSEPLVIQLARGSDKDLDGFSRFVAEHVAESGRDGSVHFAFSRRVIREEVRANAANRWSRALDEANWGRAWLCWADGGRRVVGHAELKGGRFEAELHRATLGMGLLRAHTGHGWGTKLLETSIAWARAQPKLSFIDLGVFSHNAPARKLYVRAGFVEQGVRADAYRIPGAGQVDDVMMTLALR
jgi:RimJ/RimL family protein N-acetyltransferase